MARPLAGPKDITAAFTKGGGLTVIDGRGQIWQYDTGVTTDADGEDIVAPPSFDEVAVVPGRDNLLVVAGTTIWTYSLNDGAWHEGLDITELQPGEAENTTNPWKKGHNAGTRAPAEEPAAAKASKKKAKEHA